MNNRKTAVNFDNIGNFKSFTVFPKSEQKKEFSIMFEILRDAEKYDEAGENEVCKSMLETLKNYIDSYDSEDESVNDKIIKKFKDQQDIENEKEMFIKNIREICLNLNKPEFPKDRPNTTSTNNI